ncbi:hypothetical protein D3C71_1699300 [compost metagenome]
MAGKARAINLVLGNHLGTGSTLATARAEHNDHLFKLADFIFDEVTDRVDLHPLGTPAEAASRSWITLTQQVDPERLMGFGNYRVGGDRKSIALCSFLNLLHGADDQVDNDWCFNQGV